MMANGLIALGGNLAPRQLSELAVLGLIERWKAKYARHTNFNVVHHLRRFLRAIEPDGAPHMNIPKPRPGRPSEVIITPEETARMIGAAPPHLRLFLLLIGQLGLRFAEAANLLRGNWNAQEHSITFPKKGGDLHTLPTTPEIEQLLELVPEGTTISCVAHLRGPRGTWRGVVTQEAIRAEFERLRKRVGIADNITPHAFRRAIACHLYDNSNNLRMVQQLLGHVSLATTAGYLQHREPDKLRSLLDGLRVPYATDKVQ